MKGWKIGDKKLGRLVSRDLITLTENIRNTKYEIFIASGTNIKYMETTCNKDMENDKQN